MFYSITWNQFSFSKIIARVANKYKSQESPCSELNLKVLSGYSVLIENMSLKFTALQRTSYLAFFLSIFYKQYSKLLPPKKYLPMLCEKAEVMRWGWND